MTLQECLKAALARSVEAGDNLNSIARAANISPPSLYRFASGERGLTLDTASPIPEALGLALVPTGGVAAPDLLEACEAMVKLWVAFMNDEGCMNPLDYPINARITQIQAAIAKARKEVSS